MCFGFQIYECPKCLTEFPERSDVQLQYLILQINKAFPSVLWGEKIQAPLPPPQKKKTHHKINHNIQKNIFTMTLLPSSSPKINVIQHIPNYFQDIQCISNYFLHSKSLSVITGVLSQTESIIRNKDKSSLTAAQRTNQEPLHLL